MSFASTFGGVAGFRSGLQQHLSQKRAKKRQSQTAGMFNQMTEQSKAAEAASDARYQQMLDIADRTTGQRGADIRSDAAGQSAASMQQLARLGMSGTTVAPTMQKGITRDMNAELNRAADAAQQTKLGILGQQAAAGERFAGQRVGILGRQAQLSNALSIADAPYRRPRFGGGSLLGRGMSS